MQTQPKSNLVTKIRLKRRWTRTQWFRFTSLLIFLAYSGYSFIMHSYNEANGILGPDNKNPGVDSLSPMGGLESLWIWIQTGETLKHIHFSDMILLLAVVVMALLLGGAFCGWICPFGALQEWMYRLRAKWIPWQISLPDKVDQVLRYGRFVVLFLILFFTYLSGEFIFADYCPWKAAWEIGNEEVAIFGLAILGLVVAAGLLIERAWCRYLCPLGAFMGLFNKIAPVRLRRTESTCTTCNLCNKRCPMGIDVENATAVTDTSCNHCLECVDACPKPDTLDVKGGKKKISGPVYGTAAVAIFMGVVGISMATGTWEATASEDTLREKISTGEHKADDVKDFRTLQDIANMWEIPLDLIYRELKMDQATVPPKTRLEDISALTNGRVDAQAVKDVMKRWQNGELK